MNIGSNNTFSKQIILLQGINCQIVSKNFQVESDNVEG